MRVKLLTFGITAVAIIALVLQAPPPAIAQGNANKPAAAPKKAKAKPPAPPNVSAPAATQTTMTAEKPAAKKPVRRKKKGAMAMKGVPSGGVSACLKHLSEMASKDPLIPYEGHPEEIVNNGLMWNDPKSKCSIGSDENARKKVFELTGAWRMKDASRVRSIIQELEGMPH
ncbi:MAG: hypothetical protein WAV20_05360 [Blastocatellia bacterium]